MGRRPPKIKVEVVWETSDDPNAILPWVKVTKLLIKGLERRKLYMERIEKEDPTLYLVENFVSFVECQDDVTFHTHRHVPFHVEVPLDMIRDNKGFLYTLETSGRTRTEPLSSLTKIADHYLLTHSLNPSEYSKITRTADFTLPLLSQFLTHSAKCDAHAEPGSVPENLAFSTTDEAQNA